MTAPKLEEFIDLEIQANIEHALSSLLFEQMTFEDFVCVISEYEFPDLLNFGILLYEECFPMSKNLQSFERENFRLKFNRYETAYQQIGKEQRIKPVPDIYKEWKKKERKYIEALIEKRKKKEEAKPVETFVKGEEGEEPLITSSEVTKSAFSYNIRDNGLVSGNYLFFSETTDKTPVVSRFDVHDDMVDKYLNERATLEETFKFFVTLSTENITEYIKHLGMISILGDTNEVTDFLPRLNFNRIRTACLLKAVFYEKQRQSLKLVKNTFSELETQYKAVTKRIEEEIGCFERQRVATDQEDFSLFDLLFNNWMDGNICIESVIKKFLKKSMRFVSRYISHLEMEFLFYGKNEIPPNLDSRDRLKALVLRAISHEQQRQFLNSWTDTPTVLSSYFEKMVTWIKMETERLGISFPVKKETSKKGGTKTFPQPSTLDPTFKFYNAMFKKYLLNEDTLLNVFGRFMELPHEQITKYIEHLGMFPILGNAEESKKFLAKIDDFEDFRKARMLRAVFYEQRGLDEGKDLKCSMDRCEDVVNMLEVDFECFVKKAEVSKPALDQILDDWVNGILKIEDVVECFMKEPIETITQCIFRLGNHVDFQQIRMAPRTLKKFTLLGVIHDEKRVEILLTSNGSPQQTLKDKISRLVKTIEIQERPEPAYPCSLMIMEQMQNMSGLALPPEVPQTSKKNDEHEEKGQTLEDSNQPIVLLTKPSKAIVSSPVTPTNYCPRCKRQLPSSREWKYHTCRPTFHRIQRKLDRFLKKRMDDPNEKIDMEEGMKEWAKNNFPIPTKNEESKKLRKH